ncbi:hypothetical protein BMI85_06470 [Thioclava sp. DLFJ4-1]|nr:hypothetical protein BMI85_06470 [Thioclava sp. DLFJ4-1]
MSWIAENWADLSAVTGQLLTVAGAAWAVRSLLRLTPDAAVAMWKQAGGLSSVDDRKIRDLPAVRQLLSDASNARWGVALAAVGTILQALHPIANLVH